MKQACWDLGTCNKFGLEWQENYFCVDFSLMALLVIYFFDPKNDCNLPKEGKERRDIAKL
jgi:hypothetical protein